MVKNADGIHDIRERKPRWERIVKRREQVKAHVLQSGFGGGEPGCLRVEAHLRGQGCALRMATLRDFNAHAIEVFQHGTHAAGTPCRLRNGAEAHHPSW